MNVADLLSRALQFEFLSQEEGIFLFKEAPTADLMYTANELRKKQVPHNKVTWIIDRNVNTTNVCIANCKFCNFFWDSRFKKWWHSDERASMKTNQLWSKMEIVANNSPMISSFITKKTSQFYKILS